LLWFWKFNVLEVIEHRYDANDDCSIRVYHTFGPEVL